jgi:hypothetical protein
MRAWWLVLSSGVAMAATACSSSAVDAPADAGRADAAAKGDAAPEASTPTEEASVEAETEAAASCGDLANDAPTITVRQEATDPPVLAGGTIADGTYFLTAAVIYTGADGPSGPTGTAQTTVHIIGSTVQQTNAGTGTETYTLATGGSTLTATETCPTPGVTQATYTATATTLTVAVPAGTDEAGAKTLVETLTLQP